MALYAQMCVHSVDAVEQFLDHNNLSSLIRAHEAQLEGYEGSEGMRVRVGVSVCVCLSVCGLVGCITIAIDANRIHTMNAFANLTCNDGIAALEALRMLSRHFPNCF